MPFVNDLPPADSAGRRRLLSDLDGLAAALEAVARAVAPPRKPRPSSEGLDPEPLLVNVILALDRCGLRRAVADAASWQFGDDAERAFAGALLGWSGREDELPMLLRLGMPAGLSPGAWAARLAAAARSLRAKLDRAPPAEGMVVWHRGERSYSAGGSAPVNVSFEEDCVLEAFEETQASLNTKQLKKRSGAENVPRVMRQLAERFPGGYVRLPGRRGEGYFIDVRPTA